MSRNQTRSQINLHDSVHTSRPLIYSPLPAGKWIRLLKLEPGELDAPLHCELTTFHLSSAPSYEAISYVWGDPAKTRALICQDSIKEVTINLDHALRRMRSLARVHLVWADAVCINQADDKEKAHQVGMMEEVYAAARRVQIFLGDKNSDLASTTFDSITHINSVIQPILSDANTTWSGSDLERATIRSSLKGMIPRTFPQAIEALFSLPWFQRLWVLQEVGLAKIATAWWGSSCVDFHEIATFIRIASLKVDLEAVLPPDVLRQLQDTPRYAMAFFWIMYRTDNSWIDKAPALRSYSDRLTKGLRPGILHVLEASRRFLATVPLDHVYALLGHPLTKSQEGKSFITVDYERSIDELYYLVVSALAERSLNFLALTQQVTYTRETESGTSPPSWLPRWDCHDPYAPTASWEPYDASYRKNGQHPYHYTIDGAHLTVSACFVDTIHARTEAMQESDFEQDTVFFKHGKLLEASWLLTEASTLVRPHIYGDKAMEAFACVWSWASKLNATEHRFESWILRLLEVSNPEFAAVKLGYWRTSSTEVIPEHHYTMANVMEYYGLNRRFFTTYEGRWGLGPAQLQAEDDLVIVMGCDVPLIIRRTETTGKFKLVGHCYVYGIMWGEMLEQGRETKRITLV